MIRDVWGILRRRKWLVILPLVVIFALPTGATLVMTKNYVSEGTLEVVPNTVVKPIVSTLDSSELDPTRKPIDDALDDAKLVLGARTYLTQIAMGAGLQDQLRAAPQQTLDRIRTSSNVQPAGPQLMLVQYTGSDPVTAQRIVQTELETLLSVRRQQVQADGQAAIALFTGQVDQYTNNLSTASAALQHFQDQHPEAALSDTQKSILTQLAILRAQLGQMRIQEQQGKGDMTLLHQRDTELVNQIDSLSVPVGATPAVNITLQRLLDEQQAAQQDLDSAAKQLDAARLLAAVHTQRVGQDRILDAASLPTSPSHGKALTLAALAFVLAAAASVSLVMLAEYLDTQVRRPDDVFAAGGIPVLAVLEGSRRSA